MSGSSRRLVVLSSVLAAVLLALRWIGDGTVVRHVDAEAHTTATEAAARPHTSTHTPREPTLAAPPATPRTFRLEGQVIDQRRRAVGGVKVSVGPGRATVTELDGSFAFDDLAEGLYAVIADTGDAYAESRSFSLDEHSEPVVLELARGPSVHVRVTGDDGAPIANAEVRASGRRTRTDASGSALLRAVDFDFELVTVTAPAFAETRARIATGDDPAVTVEHTFVLGVGTEVVGIVVDEAGLPVAEALVDLDQVQGDRSDRVRADARGAFTFEAVGRGTYELRAKSDQHVTGAVLALDVDGSPPARVELHVVRGAEVAGIVVDQQGRPVAKADVRIGPRWIESRDDGTFLAAGLEAGEIEMGARTETQGSKTLVRQISERAHLDVRLVLVPSTIAGIVVDANGQPLPDVSVSARSDDPHGYGYATSDERGRFELGGMPPGTYELVATREDSRHDGAKVTVATGDRRLRLTVADRAGLAGTVLLDGRPVPYYGYELLKPDDSQPWSPTAVRDGAGRFTHDDAEPGTWTVAIVGPGFLPELVHGVRIAPGRVTELGELHVRRGRSMRGKVVDARGAAVPGAMVRVRASFVGDDDTALKTIARGGHVTRTAPDGTFRFDGVGTIEDGMKLVASHPTLGKGETELAAGQEVVGVTLAVR